MQALFSGSLNMGKTLAESKEAKIGELDGNAGANRWVFFDLNLLGDPHQPLKVLCDADNDGYESSLCGGNDCDDNDAAVHPVAAEICGDGKDNDCNGLTDAEDPMCSAVDDDADDDAGDDTTAGPDQDNPGDDDDDASGCGC